MVDLRSKLASSALVLGIRARKSMHTEAGRYLAFLINTPGDNMKLENVPVVKDPLGEQRTLYLKEDSLERVNPVEGACTLC